ncbi:MAG TPA: GNAT family protein [Candidatus Acidoferrum sp.]|nr:GNAT family protein [Candidatus Acidoferrum sp.]
MGRIVRGLPVPAFAADHPRLAIEYLTHQEELGCLRPEWRFAWMGDDGGLAARVSYWGPPGRARPVVVDLVLTDGEAAPVADLLAASLAELSVEEIEYLAERPPGDARSARTEPPALEAVGFRQIATQLRLEHTGRVADVPPPEGVDVRSVREVGHDLLAPLIAAVHEGSADRATREGDAAGELRMLRELDHDPAAWEIAFERSTGQAVGFVLPALSGDGAPVIGFIGVAPRARGRGLGAFLLARGTASLRRHPSGPRVVADVDDENRPMLRAAARVGYVPFAARVHYRRATSRAEARAGTRDGDP